MEKDGSKGGNAKMFTSEPGSPQHRSFKDARLVSSSSAGSFVKGVSGNIHIASGSSRSMAAALPPLPSSKNNGGMAVVDGKANGGGGGEHAPQQQQDRVGGDLAYGGVGKVFTVTPEGGMKTATNFSGELFQVVDTKAGTTPQGGALPNNVAGILYKWVNYGKGWRPRWFALKEGVFSYYKVHGHDKVTVNDNRFKSFRIIGEEAQRFMKKQKYSHIHLHSQARDGGDQSPFKASGEIHLKVGWHREKKPEVVAVSAFVTGIILVQCVFKLCSEKRSLEFVHTFLQ